MGLLVAPDSHGYPHTPAAITVLATVEHSLPSQAWQPWLPWAITALPTLETQGLSLWLTQLVMRVGRASMWMGGQGMGGSMAG